MENVRQPITTNREGNKITKVCVEDVYKMVNRIQDGMNKSYNECVDVIDTLQHEDFEEDNSVIIGTGISQPCLTDAFDEEIGNSIAFMKAKLNANIKKHRFVSKIIKRWEKAFDVLDVELEKIDALIAFDLENLRKHNPDYLPNIEEELGLYYEDCD